MSINYIYVCDEAKEWIDPYPLDAPHLYTWMQSGICNPLGEYVEGWYGKSVRLISDGGDQEEYYLRKSETKEDAEVWGDVDGMYKDVTKLALAQAALYFEGKWWIR